MDSFCETPFWDSEKTWNTTNPDFTQCFESTVLVWVPSAFLWLFSSMDIYNGLKSMDKNVPRSPLNICKTVFTLCLIIIETTRLGYAIVRNNDTAIYHVEFLTPAIRISTYVLFLFLLFYSLKMGIQSSGIQFIYWFLTTIAEIITFRTVLLEKAVQKQEKEFHQLLYILQVCNFCFVLGEFLLNCWADVRPLETQDTDTTNEPCPERGSSFLNKLLFFWFDSTIWNGFKKPLENSDLWDLNPRDKSKYIVPLFDKYWNLGLVKSNERSLKNGNGVVEKKATFSNQNGNVEIADTKKSNSEKNYTSVVPVLFKVLGGTFIFGQLLKFIPDILSFLSPFILRLLIEFTDKNSEINHETWKGYLYASVLFICPVISTLITAQYSNTMYLVGLRIRTGLVSVIYKKALKISNTAKRETTVGEIVNLMSVDVQRVMDIMPFVGITWSGPFQIGLATYFLWGILGPFSLAGLAVMILLLPVNAIIAIKLRKLQILQMKYKDQRVKLMNEVLNGVKVLKLYAWEPSFEEKILDIRAKEIDILKKTAWLNAGANFCWTCAPFLVALSTFASYVLSDEKNILTAEKAFVSLSYFNIISVPLSFLPMVISFLVQAGVSVKRLNKFLNSEEIDTTNVTHDHEGDPIVIENGHFSWEDDKSILKGINLSIKEGSLVAVVGVVGSGKSSLLNAILGEMNKLSGKVNTRGSIGYVNQQAWIMNATLRDNILFSLPYDTAKYDRVIDSCALRPDLQILPAGDKTEIGEKGINLSGGQKQRVSLARATYFNADVYLLDDPLSAVDSHVGKHIFEHVIGPKGSLRRKTRILVTHGVAFLHQMDQIIVMKDGEISEVGTFKELVAKKAAFADFLTQHLTSNDDDLDEDDDDIIPEEIKKIKRALSAETSADHDSSAEVNVRKRSVSKSSRKMSEISESSIKLPSILEKEAVKEKLIEAEKSETSSVKISVYLDYFRKAGWGYFFCTILFYLLFQGFSVSSNLWLSAWSNEASNSTNNGTQSTSKRDMYLGVYGAFGVFQSISIMTGTIIVTLGTLKSSSALHKDMLIRILQAPMSFFDSTPIGRIVNRFAKDVDTADNTIPFNLRFWLNGFFQVLATITVISFSTPIFLAVIIPIGAVYYFIQKIYVATSRQLKRLESVTRSPIYSHFGETIQGASTIRAFGMEENFILESEKRVDQNQRSYFPAMTSNRWLAIRLETIGNLVVFFAALFVVIGKDSLTPGIVGLSVSYAMQIVFSLIIFVRWTSDLETNAVSVERLIEYSEINQEAPRDVDTNKPDKSWPAEGSIKFEKYQTRYREGLDFVLKGVTCEIKPGEKVGVVGRTGAGKSSLTLALFRIIEPSSGSITIDGKDITKMGLHDVRGRLTIIPQDPVLFSGTLRMNLDPFYLYTDEKIWKALEMSHLKKFASELPAGLQHEIAEGGENLSVGQRQLVCLARALLRKSKILVLDEATAAIDLDTDDLIQNTIRSEFKDSTVITIAHRLNTIMDSSRVMVLDNGEIKEYESPEVLLQDKGSIFYSMAKDAGIVNHS